MATTLFLQSNVATTHRGTNTAKLNGTTSGWKPFSLETFRGGSVSTSTTSTVTGPTSGVECVDSTGGGSPLEWMSAPLSADVTISGTITANIWASESSMSANVAINVVIDKVAATTNAITQVVKSTFVTELGTSLAAQNFTSGMTSGAYTGVAFSRGDRIRIRVFGDDSTGANMATGFTFAMTFNGNTGAASGDTFVTFTENLTFETTSGTPAGTQIWLRNLASDVSTASVDLQAWTTQGSGSSTGVTNTQNGWVSPIQMTDTAGGTVIDWFTPKLVGFTLGGLAKAVMLMNESNNSANASARCEIAIVNSDGTNPVVWSSWCLSPPDSSSSATGELQTASGAQIFWMAGDDTTVNTNQRLRIRLYSDDTADAAMATGFTTTVTYDTSDSAGCQVVFAQTLTQAPDIHVPRYGFVNHQNPGVFMWALRQGWQRLKGILGSDDPVPVAP